MSECWTPVVSFAIAYSSQGLLRKYRKSPFWWQQEFSIYLPKVMLSLKSLDGINESHKGPFRVRVCIRKR